MSDTVMRQWQMLRMVPRSPSKIGTTDIKVDVCSNIEFA